MFVTFHLAVRSSSFQ